LWLSGLRRSEALTLSWDQDEAFCVSLADEVFVIRAEGQKSGKAETCPMAPDFVAWLREIPEDERTGRVFSLIDIRTNQPLTPERVTAVMESIGKATGVKVGTRSKKSKEGKVETVPAFAGCHSYRRGFGSKWARRVSPSVLRCLMRHADINTTMKYYVTMDASDVARELREKFGSQNGSLQQSANKPPADSIRQ
jgi:integrase